MLLEAQVFCAGFVTWKLGLALGKYLVIDHNQVNDQEKRGFYSFQQGELQSFSPRLWCVLSHSRVWLFVTPWTVACQGPLSMGNL